MVAAKRFFKQAKEVVGHAPERVTTDGHIAYPRAIHRILGRKVVHRTSRYPNNRMEQDHRGIKRRVNPGLGFWSFETAWRTIQGYEATNQLRKGQVRGTIKGDIMSQVRFVSRAFGLAA